MKKMKTERVEEHEQQEGRKEDRKRRFKKIKRG
jgi:hypothetical protein